MAFNRNSTIHDITAENVIETALRKFVRPEHLAMLERFPLSQPEDGDALVYDKISDKYVSQTVSGITLAGDMLKKDYDVDGDGIIDVAETLYGLLVSISDLNTLSGIKNNVQSQIDNLIANNMTQAKVQANIANAITALKDGVSSDGDTLAKLRGLITNVQTLIGSNDVNLDTVQEIVNYIKSNKTLLDNVTINKVSVSDIINDFTHTDTNKPASANTVKLLNDMIAVLSLAVSNYGNAVTTLLDTIVTKVDKVNGKGLSTEDFTTALKTKLENLYDTITTSTNLMVVDSANNFESTTKNLEYILAEIGANLNTVKSKADNMLTMTKYSYSNMFAYDDFTEIFNIATIGGSLVNTIIDILNTSDIDILYQIYAGDNLLYDGIIPPGRRISFEAQRQDLVIKIKGSGTIEINSNRIV